ncbi:MAG: response regulator transcription factor [Muribaculaceae bacterium]
MKLLIIEDEEALGAAVAEFLGREDYLCEHARTCREALYKVAAYEYDCILLDLMLPDGSGLDILRQVRKLAPQTGVIIVSAKDSLDDKIEGLKIGADDYLPKPFHLPELSMRIFALLRRKKFTGDNMLRTGPLLIDLPQRKVTVEARDIALTRSEYDLLLFLIQNRRRVVSKSAIAEHLSGEMADMLDDYGFVYAHVKDLKAKLGEVGMTDCIKNIYGTGYKWNIDE